MGLPFLEGILEDAGDGLFFFLEMDFWTSGSILNYMSPAKTGVKFKEESVIFLMWIFLRGR